MNFYIKETEILDEKSRTVLNLLLLPNPVQKDLDSVMNCFSTALPDDEILLLLLNFQTDHPSLLFPESYSLEFKRIHTLYRRSSSCLIAHFWTISSGMEKSGIEFALIKGGAMYCLAPGYLRNMADIDILVRSGDFTKTLNIVKRAGYTYSVEAHSADVHTADSSDGVMDVHRFIPLTSGKGKGISRDIIARSRRKAFYEVSCLLPCNADILFISLTNFSRNLMDDMRPAKIISSIVDFKYLVAGGVDWNIFIEDCSRTGSNAEVAFTVSLVNSISPGVFPENLENLAGEIEKRRFLDLFLFRRKVLVPLQNKRSELRLWNVVGEPGKIPQFLLYRPLYLILKLFKYSPRAAAARPIKMLRGCFR